MEVDGNLDTDGNEISKKTQPDADASISGAVRLPGALERAKSEVVSLLLQLTLTRRILPTCGIIFRSSWGF
jgi:hypothetical protein